MRRLTGLAALALLAAVAGCQQGNSRDTTTPGARQGNPVQSATETVAAAYTATTTTRSAKITLTSSGGLALTGAGAIDFADHGAALTLSLPQLGNIETRQVGNVLYEKLPPQLSTQLGRKPWLRLDLDKLAQQAGVSAGQLGANTNSDPAQTLQYLQGVSSDVHEVGHEDIRGVSTTHYAATVDLQKAAAKVGATSKKTLELLQKQSGGAPLPIDVWLDGDHRVRQLRVTVPAPKGPAFTITEQLYDFGTPVHVTAPPADQTAAFADLVKK